jgi:hypothetical protein
VTATEVSIIRGTRRGSDPWSALVDGNKRLAWLATAVFLEINGVEISRAGRTDQRVNDRTEQTP